MLIVTRELQSWTFLYNFRQKFDRIIMCGPNVIINITNNQMFGYMGKKIVLFSRLYELLMWLVTN